MKIIKFIVVAILSLVAIFFIAAIFVPKDYTVSVSTTINQPQAVVNAYIKQIKNQENYSIWAMAVPKGKMVYKGTDGTVGFSAAWNTESDDIGEGQQVITSISENRVDVDLHFVRPFKSNQKAATFTKAISATQTEVTNEFYGHDNYPFNMMSFIGKKIIREAQGKNMANLKALLEQGTH